MSHRARSASAGVCAASPCPAAQEHRDAPAVQERWGREAPPTARRHGSRCRPSLPLLELSPLARRSRLNCLTLVRHSLTYIQTLAERIVAAKRKSMRRLLALLLIPALALIPSACRK